MSDEPIEFGVADAPSEEDERHDDAEFNPAIEPKSAKAWLNLLQESEDNFEPWNRHCDNLDRLYASLERLSSDGTGRINRNREYQMFWANAEVLKPSIYAKPPVPVVAPKFKDRRAVYQAASEVAERCAVVAFDLAGINDLMLLVRDDLSMISRGVAWCRYEGGENSISGTERVCIDFKHRKDFLHSISRNWREVTWVAGASYLTRAQARKRFEKYSGDEYQRADYRVDKEAKNVGGADARERAKFWEIWSKGDKRVVWVCEGCENILDEAEPHLDLREFFPCPKPAFGTVQRGSLVPVPDAMQYRDQLDEINLLTGKIHALSEALEAKGFYPAGGAELADAIQAAVETNTPGRLLVPISNWASFGGTKEIIVWMPIDVIAQTVQGLVALRKEIITDIYQIMGFSDIMRGSTDPNETLGAQQLKTQYGSTRIRDKQQEMVRIARDLVEITLEIITEKFKPETIIAMSQTQLPTTAMQKQAYAQKQQELQQQLGQMQSAYAQASAGQADPNQVQQLQVQMQQTMMAGQQELQKIADKPTIEQVLHFLGDSRAKAFTLDIETDSTIMADENAEKQRRGEFIGVLAQLLPQLAQMIQAEPRTAEFCGELLKFATAPFRAGRSLDGAIDGLIEQMKAKGDQPRGDDPATAQGKIMLQVEQMKDQTAQKKIDADAQLAQAELQMKDQHKAAELANQRQLKQMELQAKQGDNAAKAQVQNQKAIESREQNQVELLAKQQDMQLNRQKADLAIQTHNLKASDLAQRQGERQQAAQLKAAQLGQGGI
jgi:hypothetical protein